MCRLLLMLLLIIVADLSIQDVAAKDSGRDNWPMPDPELKNVVNSTNHPSIVDVILRYNGSARGYWEPSTSTKLGVIISSNYVLMVGWTKTPCNYSVLIGSHGLNHPWDRNGTEHEAELILYKNPDEKDHFTRDPDENMALLKLKIPIELGTRYRPASLPEVVKVGDEGVFAAPAHSNQYVRTYDYFAECYATVVSLHECAPHIRFTFDQPKWVSEYDLLPEEYFCVRSATTPPCELSPLFIQGQVAGFERKELYTDSHVDNRGLFKFTIIYNAARYSSWIKNITGV